MDFEQLSDHLTKLTSNLRREIEIVLNNMSEEIIKANQNALDRGELSTGKKMPRLRNELYIEYKFNKGSKSAPFPDLKDAGSFWDKMRINIAPETIVILSTDSKLSDLVEKYSIDIFGVQEQELPRLQKIFKDNFLKRLDEIL